MKSLISCIFLCVLSCAIYSAEGGRPWLGISLETTGDFDARVVIKTVRPNSTASEMGLKVKDVITDFKGQRINGIDDLQSALKDYKAGDKIQIGIDRDGSALTLQGVLKERPSAGRVIDAQKILTEKAKELGKIKDNSNTNAALALSLHGLSKTLDQLPEKIEEAAREFKEVYPDGEFVVKVEISISSKKKDSAESDTDNEQAPKSSGGADQSDEQGKKQDPEQDNKQAKTENKNKTTKQEQTDPKPNAKVDTSIKKSEGLKPAPESP